ncbi:MAG: carboxypeptidase-like regulatory domain-containing protein [Pirellulaceae bacterium]
MVPTTRSVGETPQFVPNKDSYRLDLQLRDQSGIIAGTVVDADGTPLAEQEVRFSSLYDHLNRSVMATGIAFCFDWTATSDTDGRFAFAGIPGGLIASISLVTGAAAHAQEPPWRQRPKRCKTA